MGQVSPSCFSETPMTQRTPHSRLAPTPGPASPRPPAPDTPGPPTLGWQRAGGAPNEPLARLGRAAPPNRHKETILADPDGKGRARARMRRGSRKCPPRSPCGVPSWAQLGPPIQPPVSVPRGLSVPMGAEGQRDRVPRPHSCSPGRAGCVIPLLCSSPSALLGRGTGGRKSRSSGTARLPSLESGGSHVGRKEVQEHFQEAPVPSSRFPKGWGGDGSAPAPPAAPRGSGSALPVLRRLRDAGRAQQSMNGRSGFLPPRRPPGAGGSSCSALAS